MESRHQWWGVQGDIWWGGALVRKPYWLSKQTTSQSYKVGNEGRHFKYAEMAGIWVPKIYPSLQKSLLIDDNHHDGLKDVYSLLWIPLLRVSLIFSFQFPDIYEQLEGIISPEGGYFFMFSWAPRGDLFISDLVIENIPWLTTQGICSILPPTVLILETEMTRWQRLILL